MYKYHDDLMKFKRYAVTDDLIAFYDWFFKYPRVNMSKAHKRRRKAILGPIARKKIEFLSKCNNQSFHTGFNIRCTHDMKSARAWKQLIKLGYVEVLPSSLGNNWLCFRLL